MKEGEKMSSTNSKISNQALNIMLQDIKGHKDGSDSLLLPARQLEIVAALIEAELDRRTVIKTKDGWPVKGIRKDKDGITVSLDVRDMPDAFAYSHAIQEHLKPLRSESYKPESTGGQTMEPVFICSPYQGREDNYRLAKMYMAMAAERGYYPVAPHVMIHGVLNDHDEETRNGAIKVGLKLIDLCKTVLVFGDIFTPGMKEEIRYALDRNYRTETISSAECLIWLQEKYDMKRQAYDSLKENIERMKKTIE